MTASYTIACFAFRWTNVHTPLYIAVFMQQITQARSLSFTKGILTANVVGGLIGWVMYELLVMTPNFLFVTVLSLAVVLTMARMMVSGTPTAPLAGAALSVLTIVPGGAMIAFGDNESDKLIDRLGKIGMAAIYAVTALCVLEACFPSKKPLS